MKASDSKVVEVKGTRVKEELVCVCVRVVCVCRMCACVRVCRVCVKT